MNESEQSSIAAPLSTAVPKQRASRMAAEKALPQSSAETLVKIIKGYAIASNGGQSQINYKDVASVSGIAPTVVSGNNKFLLESEILISPKFGYYVPSEGAVRFAREAAWDEPAAKAHLRDVIASTWYGQTALQNLMLRPSLRRDELKRALAIKAGATEGDSNALEFLIDFLIYTGVIAQSETGTIVKGDVDSSQELTSRDITVEPAGVSTRADIFAARAAAPGQPNALTLALHIHVNSAEDLTDEYAVRIRQWMDLVRGTAGEVSIDVQPESDSSSESP
jgi:hypothetical protein